MCTDRLPIEPYTHGLVVTKLSVVDVHSFRTGVARRTDLLALRNELPNPDTWRLFVVNVVRDPSLTMVNIDSVSSVRSREDVQHDTIGGCQYGLTFANIASVAIAARNVDAVLVGPVPIVSGGVPSLAARERSLETWSLSSHIGTCAANSRTLTP